MGSLLKADPSDHDAGFDPCASRPAVTNFGVFAAEQGFVELVSLAAHNRYGRASPAAGYGHGRGFSDGNEDSDDWGAAEREEGTAHCRCEPRPTLAAEEPHPECPTIPREAHKPP